MRQKIIDISWMLYGQGGRLIFQTMYFLLLAFMLGPSEYGIYVVIAALIIILGPFCGVGYNSILTKTIVTDSKKIHEVFGNAIKVTIYSYIFLMFCGVTFLFFIFDNPILEIKLFLVLSIADLLLLKFNEMSAQIFIAKKKMKVSAHIQTFISLTRLLSLLVYYLFCKYSFISESLLNWAFIYVCCSFLYTLIVFLYTLNKNERPNFNNKISFSSLKEGVYFSIGLSSQGVYNDIDKTIVGKYTNSSITGYYGFAYKMLDVLFIPIKAILALTYPKYFEIGNSQGIKGTLNLSKKIVFPLMIYSLLASLMAFFLVPPLLEMFFNGNYGESSSYFLWLLPIVFFRCIHYVFADALTGAGFQKQRSYIQISVAVLNLVLNLILISIYGVFGAIFVSLLSDIIMVILILSLIRIKMKNKIEV